MDLDERASHLDLWVRLLRPESTCSGVDQWRHSVADAAPSICYREVPRQAER